MTKSLAYIGVVVLVVGLVLTTCVGTAWSMDVLTDEEMASIRGRHEPAKCTWDLPGCGSECLPTGDPVWPHKEAYDIPYTVCEEALWGSCANDQHVKCAEWKKFSDPDVCFGTQQHMCYVCTDACSGTACEDECE